MNSGALVYAVRGRVVLVYLGQLLLPLALALLVPTGLAALAGSWGAAGMLAGTAVLAGVAGRKAAQVPDVDDLQTNESMVVVALAFLVAALVMVPPFVSYGLTPTDAFFEAVSAITTTGLSTLPTDAEPGDDFLLMRNWLQWLGGLGFVTLSVLLVSRRGPADKRLLEGESTPEGLAAHTRAQGRRALELYVGLTLAGTALLALVGVPFVQAVGYAWSSVSTGGFVPPGADLAGMGAGARGALLLLFALGAVPLVTLHRGARGRWREALRDPQVPWLVGLGVVSAGLIVLFTEGGGSWLARAGEALFLAFSAQTTTGYAAGDPATLPAAATAVLLVAMFIGGCGGSTAGGIKIWRALVALRLGRHTVVETALPEHAVHEPEFAGAQLEHHERQAVLVLALLFLGVIGLSWLAFLAAGHPPLDALFDVVSATGTVGLSTGVAGPGLDTPLKWVLAVDMLMGRLEILAVLVLLAPRSWVGRRRSSA